MESIVLSIGKLATGQAGYYLEQAGGSLSRAAAVSSGVEDYYLGEPEAAGVWTGAGAAALGLKGSVDGAALTRVLSGEHPATGAALGRVLATRRPGFDLTFSAPKGVSVLFGVGDDALRAVLRDAHDQAVQDALGYLEREAAVTRRGAGGAQTIAGNGFVAAAFRHRTSRAGDPQLHTHVLVANLTLGADGRWSTLDGRRIYAHAKTAGYLYEARLRAELTRRLGVEWMPVRNGIAEIDGVPAAVLRAFSRRRADIEAELERRGASGAAAAQVATLATRRGKDYRVTPEQLVPEWRTRAAQLGLTAEHLPHLQGRCLPARLDTELERRIADGLAAADGLTQRRSTFTRRDVIQGFCERLPAAATVTVEDIERAAGRFLASERAVVLAVGERARAPANVLRRSDGRVVPLVRGERAYSTAELLALERRIIDHAASTRAAGLGVAREVLVERVVARRPTMSEEQAVMVRRLTLEGDGVAIVVGQAGSGKTFALAAAREAWRMSGHRVVGAAVARRAAGQLEQSAGIESTSVAALLTKLDGRGRGLLPRTVLVVDEAGMVSTRELARLVDHADRARAKLVVVGDHRQLAEIEAGGAFRALATRLPVIELHENRRQAERWERDALALLRDGHAVQALERYRDRGRIVAGEDGHEVRGRLVGDWWAAGDPARSVMIAHRRSDVADLNGRARALMRATGALGQDELQVTGRGFAAGDHVVLRRNEPRLGVVNGDRGTVTAVDPAARAVEVALPGGRVRLDAGYLDSLSRHGSSLQHAYAITGHVAQGLTFRQTFVLMTDQISREWGYSALSRGSEANRLYAVDARDDERDDYAPANRRSWATTAQLAAALGRTEAQRFAIDRGREQRLVGELERTLRERDAADDDHRDTVQARRELEGAVPHPLRRRARQDHRLALAQARTAEALAATRVKTWREREATLRDELERERAIDRTAPSAGEIGRVQRSVQQRRLARLGLDRPERVLGRASDSGVGIER